jgi:hypothetical protein
MPTAKQCDYEHIVPQRRGAGRVRIRIQCSACRDHADISVSGGQETLTQESADRAFHRRGWLIGRNRAHDICPSCHRRSPRMIPRTELRASGLVAESSTSRKGMSAS